MTSKGKAKAKPPAGLLTGGGDKKARFKDEDKDSLAFKVLTADHTKELLELEDEDSVQKRLGELLEATDCSTDLKAGAVLDYYVSGFWWCKQQSFEAKQASAFFTVLHQMLENVKEKQLGLTECLIQFKKLFAGIGTEHPEVSGGLGCFDITQATLVADYFHTSFFQHYKMYEFLFTCTQAEEIIGTDLTVEVPKPADLPWPSPLEEAVPEDIYTGYICTPPPTPKVEEPADKAGAESPVETSGEVGGTESEQVADLLAQLTTDQVKDIMNTTFDEMLGGLKVDVQAKLRQKENDFINRINKIHRTSSASTTSKS